MTSPSISKFFFCLFFISFPVVGENGLSDSSHYCQVSLLRAGWEVVVVVVEPIRVGAGL